MPEHYRIYGLRLRSNVSLPGFVATAPADSVDTEVWFGLKPPVCDEITLSRYDRWYASPYLHEDGRPNLEVTRFEAGFFHARYGDGTEFWIEETGKAVWCTWPAELTLEDTAIYFEGPILGFVLRLHGITCLHASAIAVGEEAVALVGPAGAGKSTTAAAFSSLGYPVLSEDVVALSKVNGTVSVQPGYPRVRLWPNSFETPYGSSDALPTLTPTWDKRYLNLSDNGHRFQPQPLPLSAIYVLGERSNDPAAPFVEDLASNSKLLTLVTNTYTNYMLSPSMRASEFELLGQLVGSLPIKKVVPHADPRFLSQLCEVIAEDFQQRSVHLSGQTV